MLKLLKSSCLLLLLIMVGCSTVTSTGNIVTQAGVLKYHYIEQDVVQVVLQGDLSSDERETIRQATKVLLEVYDKIDSVDHQVLSNHLEYSRLKIHYLNVYNVTQNHWDSYNDHQKGVLLEVHKEVLDLDRYVETFMDSLQEQEQLRNTLLLLSNLSKIISVM